MYVPASDQGLPFPVSARRWSAVFPRHLSRFILLSKVVSMPNRGNDWRVVSRYEFLHPRYESFEIARFSIHIYIYIYIHTHKHTRIVRVVTR